VGDTRWEVVPEACDRLLGLDGLRLDEWLRAGQARVVKHGPHRSVYAVALPGLSFHVKHNRLANTRARVRELARVSKARSECRRALSVAARGVPTVTPLAVGERVSGLGKRESFLITRSLEGTTPLNVFFQEFLPVLEPRRRVSIRQRLAVALGEFLARMHEAGIVHNDLHAGNVLVALTAADELRLHLVDLHSVRMGRPLGWRASRDNLVVFNRWFDLHVSRTDRLRCWQAYYRARCESCCWPQSIGLAPQDVVGVLARELAKRTHCSLQCFWRQRDQRSLRSNRYYRRVRAHGVVGHVAAELDPTLVAALLADPDEPFRRAGVKILKDSRSSKVVEFDLMVNGELRRVIYKRFEDKSRARPWLSLLRRPPALRSWVNGHALRERCLPTARPLVVLHRRRFGLLHQGYFLSLKIQGAVELPRFLDDVSSLACRERQTILRDRIEQTARLIRQLHHRGVSHRDLKGANILTKAMERRASSNFDPARHTWNGGEGFSITPDVYIIDLVGVALSRQVRLARRVQNLARLNASVGRHPVLTRTDLLRFLRVYLQWGLHRQSRWKSWWRAVADATRAKQQRNARNGRPLH
jgi:tRNA A-37 threonylcarbamoyl transferase component Bud32